MRTGVFVRVYLNSGLRMSFLLHPSKFNAFVIRPGLGLPNDKVRLSFTHLSLNSNHTTLMLIL